MINVDSTDKEGRYCGMREDGTSAVEESKQGGMLVGYCGPNCFHCKDMKVYELQNGVWVCAADYDYPEQL